MKFYHRPKTIWWCPWCGCCLFQRVYIFWKIEHFALLCHISRPEKFTITSFLHSHIHTDLMQITSEENESFLWAMLVTKVIDGSWNSVFEPSLGPIIFLNVLTKLQLISNSLIYLYADDIFDQYYCQLCIRQIFATFSGIYIDRSNSYIDWSGEEVTIYLTLNQ